MSYDAIVVGSGIGGLTTAVFLAKAGKKVLVLEQHYEPGGLTHTFARQGYVWDVGLHYVGDVAEGSENARVARWASGGRLAWEPFPGVVEELRHRGRKVSLRPGFASVVEEWIRQFPEEGEALGRFYRRIKASAAWMRRHRIYRALPPVLQAFAFPLLWGRGWSNRKFLDVLNQFSSPELRSLLASQWGDYGLRPDQASFGIHAMIANHYLEGAFTPVGGAVSVAQTMMDELVTHGGEILVAHQVLRVNVEGRRATGVLVRNLTAGTTRNIGSRMVISAVGAEATYQRLLSGEQGPRLDLVRRAIDALPRGASMFVVFLGLRDNPRKLGMEGQNTWISDEPVEVSLEESTRSLLRGEGPGSAFLSFPSARSSSGRPVAQVMVAVDPEVFLADPRCAHRPSYEALKADLADRLLALTERHWPGFRDLVVHQETAGPGTIERYTGRTSGAMYGLAETPQRLKVRGLGPRTPVRNLYLTGSDVCTLGIVGAMMGGFMTAGHLLGFPRVFADLGRPVVPRSVPRVDPRPTASAVLTRRTRLSDRVHEFQFALEGPGTLAAWPGSFVRVRVGDQEWRAYSVAQSSARQFSLLVDLSGQGVGARFFSELAPGQGLNFQGPLGSFRYEPSSSPVVFVSSGSGLAPLLPMVVEAVKAGRRVTVVTAARTRDENFAPARIRQELQGVGDHGASRVGFVSYLSRETGGLGSEERAGRMGPGWQDEFLDEVTDLYLCAHPEVSRSLLRGLVHRPQVTVYQEAY